MVDALARAAAALGEPAMARPPARAARFLTASLRDDQGRLVHSWRSGRPGHPAFLDDYASLANALATLHQQQPGEGWLDEATALAERMLADFADPRQGGFFYAADAQEPLIVRKKDLVHNAVPSGNGLAVTALFAPCRVVPPRRLSPGGREHALRLHGHPGASPHGHRPTAPRAGDGVGPPSVVSHP